MFENFNRYIHELNTVSIIFRLFLASVCGGIIGLEREGKRRAAGIRTYMVVCIGATIVMLTNQYVYITFGNVDPTRLGAQVISGIGFLGAGTIITTRHNRVVGLTTAAGLWASACTGLALGIGFYTGAIIGNMFILFTITVMQWFSSRIVSSSKYIELYMEVSKNGDLNDFLTIAHKNHIKVEHVEFVVPKQELSGLTAVVVTLRLPEKRAHFEVIQQLYAEGNMKFIEEL